MSARALWKATIRLGDVKVPVKLYAALTDRKIHFRLLHRKDRVPVTQQMIDPRTDQPVPGAQVKRGIEIDPGRMVVVQASELRALEPEASRDIQLERFVLSDRIQPAWTDRPYYLGPDGDLGAYFALAAALQRENKAGLARWTMRKKRYAGVLKTRNGEPDLRVGECRRGPVPGHTHGAHIPAHAVTRRCAAAAPLHLPAGGAHNRSG